MKTSSIILAAGKGTRMNSDQPKVIFKIAGEPMVNRVIRTAQEINSEKIIIVVGYKRKEVMEVIPSDERIFFAVQEPQNGTGHAIMVCRNELENFEGVVFVLYGDVPLLSSDTLRRMLELHIKEASACTVLTALMDDPLQYGRIIRLADSTFDKIVEHKDATPAQRAVKEINTGIYCFNSRDLLASIAKLKNDNSQGEYYLTDTLEILKNEGRHISVMILPDNVEASGVNSPEQLMNLENELLKRQ